MCLINLCLASVTKISYLILGAKICLLKFCIIYERVLWHADIQKFWVPASQQLNTPEVELTGQGSSWKVKLRGCLLFFRKASWALRKLSFDVFFFWRSLYILFAYLVLNCTAVRKWLLFDSACCWELWSSYASSSLQYIYMYILNILIQILYILFIIFPASAVSSVFLLRLFFPQI